MCDLRRISTVDRGVENLLLFLALLKVHRILNSVRMAVLFANELAKRHRQRFTSSFSRS